MCGKFFNASFLPGAFHKFSYQRTTLPLEPLVALHDAPWQAFNILMFFWFFFVTRWSCTHHVHWLRLIGQATCRAWSFNSTCLWWNQSRESWKQNSAKLWANPNRRLSFCLRRPSVSGWIKHSFGKCWNINIGSTWNIRLELFSAMQIHIWMTANVKSNPTNAFIFFISSSFECNK